MTQTLRNARRLENGLRVFYLRQHLNTKCSDKVYLESDDTPDKMGGHTV